MKKTVIIFFIFLSNFITMIYATDEQGDEIQKKDVPKKIVVLDSCKKAPQVLFRYWTIHEQLSVFKKAYPDATHIQGLFNDDALESVVETFPKMESLFLSAGKVTTLKPLSKLTSLHSLSLKDTYRIFNNSKEYQYLVSLPLHTVSLFDSNTIIPNFDVFKDFPFLEELILCGADDGKINFDVIEGSFASLKVLKIQKCNDIIGRGDPTIEALHKLKIKRPSLKILYLYLIANLEIT